MSTSLGQTEGSPNVMPVMPVSKPNIPMSIQPRSPQLAARIGVLLLGFCAWIVLEHNTNAAIVHGVPGLRVASLGVFFATMFYLFFPTPKWVSMPISIFNLAALSIATFFLWAKRIDFMTDALLRYVLSAALLCELIYLVVAHAPVMKYLGGDAFDPNYISDPAKRFQYAPHLGGVLLASAVFQLVATIMFVLDRSSNQLRLMITILAIVSLVGHGLTGLAFYSRSGKQAAYLSGAPEPIPKAAKGLDLQIIGAALGAVAGLGLLALGFETGNLLVIVATVVHGVCEGFVVSFLHKYD